MITPVEEPPQGDGAEFGTSAATPGELPAKAVPWSRTSKWMVGCAFVFVVGIPVSILADALRSPQIHIHLVQSVMLVACCILSPIAAWRSRTRRTSAEHTIALLVILLSCGFGSTFAFFCAMFWNFRM